MVIPPPSKRPRLDSEGGIEKHSIINIDRNGNLKLVVGPTGVQIQVDANALRRASKVFNRMLFSLFSKSNQTANWTVELPEDNPEALRVIFHVVHDNFGNLPRDFTLCKLYNITVMVDKYAMVGSLQPWGTSWLSGDKHVGTWKSQDMEETSYEDLQRLLVLYHLGSLKQFECLFADLVLKSKINQNGSLLFELTDSVDRVVFGRQHREWNRVRPLPSTIIKFTRIRRHRFIWRLLEGLDAVFASCTSRTNDVNIQRRCYSTALGLMIQHLVQTDLWPIPKADDARLSVNELSKIADKIGAESSSQVLKRCKCTSVSRGSGRCKIGLPLTSGEGWRMQLKGVTGMTFETHFSTRGAVRVSES